MPPLVSPLPPGQQTPVEHDRVAGSVRGPGRQAGTRPRPHGTDTCPLVTSGFGLRPRAWVTPCSAGRTPCHPHCMRTPGRLRPPGLPQALPHCIQPGQLLSHVAAGCQGRAAAHTTDLCPPEALARSVKGTGHQGTRPTQGSAAPALQGPGCLGSVGVGGQERTGQAVWSWRLGLPSGVLGTQSPGSRQPPGTATRTCRPLSEARPPSDISLVVLSKCLVIIFVLGCLL